MSKRDKEVLEKIIAIAKKYFSKKPKVLSCYLFGSFVSGKAVKESDVDLAIAPVFDERITLPELLEMKFEISGLLDREVDLRLLELEKTFLFLAEVLTSGTLLYEKNRGQRTIFEVKAIQTFRDREYGRKIAFDYLKKAISKDRYGHGPASFNPTIARS